MADGAVTGDLLREIQGEDQVLALEEPLDALVHEPEAGLHAHDGLAQHPEAKVPGLDDAGVHRADRNLVHPFALDLGEGEGVGVQVHRG